MSRTSRTLAGLAASVSVAAATIVFSVAYLQAITSSVYRPR